MAYRKIRKIVVTYQDAGPGQQEEFIIENRKGGEVITGVIWDEKLMKKLAYSTPGGCDPVETLPGGDRWETNKKHDHSTAHTPGAESSAREQPEEALSYHCVWLHDDHCNWTSYCGVEIR